MVGWKTSEEANYLQFEPELRNLTHGGPYEVKQAELEAWGEGVPCTIFFHINASFLCHLDGSFNH